MLNIVNIDGYECQAHSKLAVQEFRLPRHMLFRGAVCDFQTKEVLGNAKFVLPHEKGYVAPGTPPAKDVTVFTAHRNGTVTVQTSTGTVKLQASDFKKNVIIGNNNTQIFINYER